MSQLLSEVHKDERVKQLRLRKDEVKIVIEVVIDHIGRGLLKYGKVKLQNLFTLDVRKIKGRRIRNPQTGEIMYSKDYHRIGLIPSKRIKDGLKSFKK